MTKPAVEPASFRDPSGFVFTRGDTLLRQVQQPYRDDYDTLMASGLYESLVGAGLLIPHVEESLQTAASAGAYRVLRPEPVPFVSYPYEWCFSQLQDAALATLTIQREALRFGMSLKDASAYNIQFRAGKPILIDTLSFERTREGRPWVAYGQFCRHFVAPLALMARTDVRLGRMMRTFIDGIPLDLASRLLPTRTRLNPGVLIHIHLHAAAQMRAARTETSSASVRGVGRAAALGLLDSLEAVVRGQSWRPAGTAWADYYEHTNYTAEAMAAKRRIVSEMLDGISPAPRTAWDLGANTGLFSRLAAERGIDTVAWDIDPGAVELNYRACRAEGETRLLPLLQDLTSPSPDLGWDLRERKSLVRRGPADVVLALALVHHLAIANNVPLASVASFLRSMGRWLIVEFVPKSDSQTRRLLANRDDIFAGYTREGFENAFRAGFEILRQVDLPGSERTIYLMRGRD